jgi:hypothetical protein
MGGARMINRHPKTFRCFAYSEVLHDSPGRASFLPFDPLDQGVECALLEADESRFWAVLRSFRSRSVRINESEAKELESLAVSTMNRRPCRSSKWSRSI